MAKRRWTLVLVPHGSEPSRIVEVSYAVLRVAASAAAGILVLALLAGYATLSHTTDLSRTAQTPGRERSLARELGELHGRLATLADTLTRISQRDARIRVLANLSRSIRRSRRRASEDPPGSQPRRERHHRHRPPLRRDPLRHQSADPASQPAGLSFKEAADSLSLHTARLAATPSIMPTRGWLSSAFSSMRDPPDPAHRSAA